MSFCQFDFDDGQTTFRCGKVAEYRVSVTQDMAGNPPYEFLYCDDHARYYTEGRHTDPPDVYTVTELPHLVDDVDRLDDAGGDG